MSSFLDKLLVFKKPPTFYTIVLGTIVSLIILLISNWRAKIDKKHIISAIKKHGDELENLFLKSIQEGKQVIITLKNEKVYVGFIESLFEPQETNYTVITPLLSGYRDQEKKIHFTTNYLDVVNRFIEKVENEEGEDENETSETITLDTDIVIKQDEILNAGIFDYTIFKEFLESSKKKN